MYIVLTDAMLRGLGLNKPSEILVLGLVAGYSQDGQGEFYGSLSYIASVLPMTRGTAAACLRSLTEAGWLDKIDIVENGVKFCHYRVSQKLAGCIKNYYGGIAKIDTPPVANFATHSKSNDSKSTKENITPIVEPPYDSAEFRECWATLLAQPKWRNKSRAALELNARKLAAYPEAVACEMMRNTIAGGWQGLFPLKPGECGVAGAKTSSAQSRASDALARAIATAKARCTAAAQQQQGRGDGMPGLIGEGGPEGAL